MSAMYTLLKKSWRSDSFWTHPGIYKSFLKYIPLYFDTDALMQSQYWSREKIEALQDARLRKLFKDAPRVPFWDDVFQRAGITAGMPVREALRLLPITSKKDFADRSLEDIADTSLLAKSDGDHTSGSTGRPFHFYQDWHASLRSFAVTERIFRTVTGGTRYPIVYMRARERNGFTPWRHAWFFLRGHHSIRFRMDDFRRLGKKYPDGFILYGYTSSVVEVARQMGKQGIKLPIRAVMAAGENLSHADRAFVERVMKAQLFTLYASRETGFLAYECEQHKLHLSEEWAYIEIVDEAGAPLSPGKEGRIIVTCFDNRVMPFIRYELGDQGIISDTLCPCGRTLRTITLRGRTAELIELEDDRKVSLLDISATIDGYWNTIRQFQLVQKSKLDFIVKVVPGPRFEIGYSELEGELVRLIHPHVRIQWETVEAIPEAKSGKAVYFIRDFSA